MNKHSFGPKQRVQKALAAYFARKPVVASLIRPMISFTFDDFPQSAIRTAGKMLSGHGVAGTYYASMGLLGKSTEVGDLFDHGDLESVVSDGHELACHTFDHLDSGTVSESELFANCSKNRQLMSEMLGGYQLRNFSFPFGAVTLSAKSILNSTYDSCRGIQPGINRNSIDLAYLRANRVYSQYPVESLKRVIRDNTGANGWLILYTHDVTRNPSPYGCTPEYFADVLQTAIDSGADLVTVAEATRRLAQESIAYTRQCGCSSV